MCAAALFLDIDQPLFKILIRKIDVANRRPAHPGFYQRVNDGPVAKVPITFAHGPLFVSKAVTVFGTATDFKTFLLYIHCEGLVFLADQLWKRQTSNF